MAPQLTAHPLALADSAGAAEVRRKCGVLLKGRHAAERMQRCWGAGAGLRLAETRAAVAAMLKARCLRTRSSGFCAFNQASLLTLCDPSASGTITH